MPQYNDSSTEITWNYTLSGNNASIGTGSNSSATTLGTGLSGAITIPDTVDGYPVTDIGANAFRDCTSLTSVDLGNSVTTISYYAFDGCTSLTSIIIPDSVTSISLYAFRDIGSPSTVYVKDVDPNDAHTMATLQDTMAGYISGTVTYEQADNTNPTITSGTTGTTLITETGAGQTVYTINATDNIAVTSYAIGGADSGALSVNSSTGVVTLTGNPVEETKNRYNFTVTASDAAGNTSTPQSVSFIVSPACFPAGTPVLTDQGEIAIEKIDPKKHTIRGNKIEEVTKTIGIEDFLVCIKKSTLYPNVPSQDTYVTCDHKIFFKDKLYRAGFLEARAHKSGNPDLMNNICQVPYNGEVLYNVLLKDNKHDYMCVNKMIVETMDPKNVFAKYYCYLKNKKQGEKNNKIEKEYEQYISNCYAMVKKHKRSRLTQK